jgi:hypothetical protein
LFWGSPFVYRLPPYRRSPSVGNTRWETTKHRYGTTTPRTNPLNASPHGAIVKIAQMPAQNTELNRSQRFPFVEFIRIVFMEELQ